MANAGRHTAMYSAPSAPGVEYCTHSPLCVMTASPAPTSSTPSRVVTRSEPRRTTVYSSNSGVCPGSTQPPGLFIRATLHAAVFELTRPMNSSILLGLLPAASMTEGCLMCVGMRGVYLLRDPPLDGAQHMRALGFRQLVPLRNLVHLLQAAATTRRSRMLRHEDRMIPPRRLLPVISRKRRRQPLGDELRAMLHHGRQAPRLDVRTLASDQLELAAEGGGGKPAKDFVDVDHERSNAI